MAISDVVTPFIRSAMTPQMLQKMSVIQHKLAALPAQRQADLARSGALTGLAQAQTGAIPGQEALRRAQIQLTTAKASALPETALWKNPLALYNFGNQLYKANPNDGRIPIVASALNNLLARKKGRSLTTTPSGGTSLKIGGTSVGGSAAPSIGGQPSYFGHPIVNPLTKGGRGTKGITYVEPSTGQIYSSPSQQATGKLQLAIISDKALNNIADDLTKTAEKSNYFNPLTHLIAGASKFGLKYLFPQSAKAESNLLQTEAGVTSAVERTITQGNLPRQQTTMEALRVIYQPKMGENAQTYKSRVMHQLKLFMYTQEINRKALAKGIPVGIEPYKMVGIAPQSFNEYLHPKYEYVNNSNYRGPSIETQGASKETTLVGANIISKLKSGELSINELTPNAKQLVKDYYVQQGGS